MLSTVLYYELAMKVPIPVGITVYLLTWGLGHLRCLVLFVVRSNAGYSPVMENQFKLVIIPALVITILSV